jgi:subtilisin-like proprotein convertase family protein/subtilisin family serine protease
MPDRSEKYYYVGDKKIKLNKLPDSFALKYKENVPSRSIERKLLDQPGLADAEERKNMPSNRLVIITLPQTRRLADQEASIRSLKEDKDVEYVVPVYRDPQSGLRLVATDEITVRFKSDVSKGAIDKVNEENGVEIVEVDRFAPNQYTLKVKDVNDTFAIVNKYHESDLTEFAEPAFFSDFKKSSIPYFEQWHLYNEGQEDGLAGEDVKAKDAWTITKGSPDIIVAAVDDGVDIDHPDLKTNIWTNPDGSKRDVHGWNFFGDTDNPRPQKFTPPYSRLEGNDSHGTPCAGVISANGEGALGVVGIAPMCKILPVKVFMGDDMVQVKTVAQAIRYAGERADVLSNSWGIPMSNDVDYAIKDVVKTGRNGKGCLVFVATGNDYESTIGFPASVPEAIAVGASTNLGSLASYSNYGKGIAIVAPSSGGTKGIFTTDVSIPDRGFNTGNVGRGDADGLYTNSFGGTSSATPLAAGVAALILSLNPDLRWEQVRRYICNTADKIDPENGDYVEGYSLRYGFGRINAYKALTAVKNDMEGPSLPEIVEKEVFPSIAIPYGDLKGITSAIQIDDEATIDSVETVSVDITYRGDLMVSLISPDKTVIPLHEGRGGGEDGLVETYNPGNMPALKQLEGKSVRGEWLLRTADRWTDDIGTLKKWSLKFKVMESPSLLQTIEKEVFPKIAIPDGDLKGITSVIQIDEEATIESVETISVDIAHTYQGDLMVSLICPDKTVIPLYEGKGGGEVDLVETYNPGNTAALKQLEGKSVRGDWSLRTVDRWTGDIGTLRKWGLKFKVKV